MQLRKSIIAPARLEDEEPATPRNRDTTRPACPELTKARAVPFNPGHQTAAFPSLPLLRARSVTNTTEGEQTTTELETTINDSQQTTAGGPKTLSSLSYSLAGNSSDDDGPASHPDVTVARDSNPQDKESDSAIARGPATRNNCRSADSSTTATQVGRTVTPVTAVTATSSTTRVQAASTVAWSDLPLALQFRIYSGLRARTPSYPQGLPKALGLTESETKAIAEAVLLRALHPAGVGQIMEFCESVSEPVPGIEAHVVDPEIFKKYLDYMVFSSRYECAYEVDVRRAKEFVIGREISAEIVGTWLPNPKDNSGSEFLHFMPAHRPGSFPVTRQYTLPTPARQGWPFVAQVTGAPLDMKERPEPLLPALASMPLVSRKNLLSYRRSLPSRPHPLATVSRPGESPSPQQPGERIRQKAEEFSRQLLQAGIQMIPQGLTRDVPPPQDPQPTLSSQSAAQGVRAAGLPNLQARSSIGGLPATTLSQGDARAAGEIDRQKNTEPLQFNPSSRPTSTPQRLVLKIQKDTGLAQVFRKPPPQYAFISNDAPAPFEPSATLARLKADAADRLKRKASRSDIRPSANKVPRLRPVNAPLTLPQGLLSASSVAPTGDTGAATIEVVPRATPAPDSPTLPPFSPISENADLPEFQALIEPFKHRLHTGLNPEQSPTTQREKKRPQKLIFTFKAAGGFPTGPTAAASGAGMSSAPTTGTSTRVLPPTSAISAPIAKIPLAEKKKVKRAANVKTRASEQREKEAALAARAAGVPMTRSRSGLNVLG